MNRRLEEIKNKNKDLLLNGLPYDISFDDVEYLLRIAECAEDFNNSLKGKTGAILGGTSFGKLEKLRKALEGVDDE